LLPRLNDEKKDESGKTSATDRENITMDDKKKEMQRLSRMMVGRIYLRNMVREC
jgi:hypothetical protein